MGLKAALNHRTAYRYDRPINLGPQIIRLRPAPHARTKVLSYSLRVEPQNHFLNWIQDPYGNFMARVVFPNRTDQFAIEVDLVADLEVFNPFDFFLEPEAQTYPFDLPAGLAEDLRPYREPGSLGQNFRDYAAAIDRSSRKTIDFLVALNQQVQGDISYRIRLEPNVQTPDETLRLASGSCRDSTLLLVELLRACGFAARFVSGYLIQLVPDRKPLTGPAGPAEDFTDLHAWAEVFVPGAGWIGLDPTSGLLAGEGHIPLTAAPRPGGAAPVEGLHDPCEVRFDHRMTVQRLDDQPRSLKPFPQGGQGQLDDLGEAIDARIAAQGLTLTSGAEPTFVAEADRSGAEWGPDALGPTKKNLSLQLMRQLRDRWATGALIHTAQGKWYPGEPLPRWALSCFWRADGQPLWSNPDLLADEQDGGKATMATAKRFLETLADQLGVERRFINPAYEDTLYFLQKERDLPLNLDPSDSKLRDPEERARLARAFSRGLDQPAGFVLPIQRGSWKSGPWPTRDGRLILIPGDSPIGLRLPLDSLPWADEADSVAWYENDPMGFSPPGRARRRNSAKPAATPLGQNVASYRPTDTTQPINEQLAPSGPPPLVPGESAAWVIRTALCVQERNGLIYIFLPPARKAEDWFALTTEIEATAAKLGQPVVLEGYGPPYDPAVQQFQITPDPGVIEVNMPPAATWADWSAKLRDLDEAARSVGLSTEKYLIGGQVVGTGGGCHLILGGPTPAESPFLVRPDLLRSWLAYLNRHPSLSYAFAGLFIGGSSQAPRVDEGGIEAVAALELACTELDRHQGPIPPWLADRLFRNLLVDAAGNTHRSELCIDKLFSPDHAGGRRGLVEFRAFEMASHIDIALSHHLLLRALTAHFLEAPYREAPLSWGTALRDRWMLPHYLWQDLGLVLAELDHVGLQLPREPFAAHWDFRFPLVGTFSYEGATVELRVALEPWPVLGEEPGAGGTVRYVDSSVERVQVLATNFDATRFALVSHGYQVPLQAIGGGAYVAGIRFKAWQLPAGLHPTIAAQNRLVLDLFDRVNNRVVAGATWHVAHPAGRNYDEPPINAFEAEARRAARFAPTGHTPGPQNTPLKLVDSPDFPHTLDLRRA